MVCVRRRYMLFPLHVSSPHIGVDPIHMQQKPYVFSRVWERWKNKVQKWSGKKFKVKKKKLFKSWD